MRSRWCSNLYDGSLKPSTGSEDRRTAIHLGHIGPMDLYDLSEDFERPLAVGGQRKLLGHHARSLVIINHRGTIAGVAFSAPISKPGPRGSATSRADRYDR